MYLVVAAVSGYSELPLVTVSLRRLSFVPSLVYTGSRSCPFVIRLRRRGSIYIRSGPTLEKRWRVFGELW